MERHVRLRAALFVLQAAILFAVSYWLLRWAYGSLLVDFIPWNIPTKHSLGVIFLKMTAITAALAIFSVAIFAFRRMKPMPKALVTAFTTLLLLWAYVAAAEFARERWQPGMPNDIAFGYVFSSVNEHFFFEYNFLTYAIEVATLVALASGALIWISETAMKRAKRVHSST